MADPNGDDEREEELSSIAAIFPELIINPSNPFAACIDIPVTPASPLGQLVPKLQALFILRGASASTAYATAIQVIAGLVHRQATILAMQDAFRLSVILTGIAIISAFFVRYRRVPPPEQIPSEQERSEEMASREEAMLAV